MTGYGYGEAREAGFVISAEMRSLNHRFLDIDIRLPKDFSLYEQGIKEIVSKRLARGRITVTLTARGDYTTGVNMTLDKELATRYIGVVKELKNTFGLKGEIDVQQLLALPDIISFDAPEGPDKRVWAVVKQCVDTALDNLCEMRQREGEEIGKDLLGRLKAAGELVAQIQKHAAENAKEIYKKLKERVEALAGSDILGDGRMEMEVAMLAEKADVTEECIRFKSHNQLFFELLTNGNSEGRRLNFLLQEMHREANTIGAKANDAQIAQWVVNIKEEVEKLREQVQNIE